MQQLEQKLQEFTEKQIQAEAGTSQQVCPNRIIDWFCHHICEFCDSHVVCLLIRYRIETDWIWIPSHLKHTFYNYYKGLHLSYHKKRSLGLFLFFISSTFWRRITISKFCRNVYKSRCAGFILALEGKYHHTRLNHLQREEHWKFIFLPFFPLDASWRQHRCLDLAAAEQSQRWSEDNSFITAGWILRTDSGKVTFDLLNAGCSKISN